MKNFTLLLIAVMLAALFGACDDNVTQPSIDDTATEMSFNRVSADEPGFSPASSALKKGTDPIALIAINGGFDELVAALTYVDEQLSTGLVDMFLNGKDQYTVFAPTNAAFTNLYALLSTVLDTEIDEITDIPAEVVLDVLLYHVTDGRRAANSVVPKNKERQITSLLEEMFYVRTDGSIRDGLTGLRDDATIDTPNISASNGIIHVITQVIVPPSVVAALTS